MGVANRNTHMGKMVKSITPRIFFRGVGYDEHADKEFPVAQSYFDVLPSLEDIRPGDVVVGRFSLRPFYDSIEEDIISRGGQLLVTYRDYEYLNDMRRWYKDLEGLTPKTWFSTEEVDENGPFFVKGITNSLKHNWDSVFARDREDIKRVLKENAVDPLMSQQDMVIRQYVPLHTYLKTDAGMPITEEYRLFILDGELLAGGYYWTNYVDQIEDNPDINRIPKDFLDEVTSRIPVRFYVVDIGIREDGSPIVIELNDPGMTGLTGVSADTLYKKLAEKLSLNHRHRHFSGRE